MLVATKKIFFMLEPLLFVYSKCLVDRHYYPAPPLSIVNVWKQFIFRSEIVKIYNSCPFCV